MKIQANNSIFEKYNSINEATFDEKCKYFFDGEDVHKIIKTEKELKTYLYHIKLFSEDKMFEISLNYRNRGSELTFYVEYSKPRPRLYENLNDFFKDFNDYQKNQIKLKNEYQERLNKKIKQIEEEKTVIDKISNRYPEYLI